MADFQFNSDDLQMVAALYCEGMGKSDIAHILSRNETEVQRMVEAAEQRNYFTYEPRLTPKSLSPEVREMAFNEVLTATLIKALGKTLEFSVITLTITPSPPGMFTKFNTHAVARTPEWREYTDEEWKSTQMVSCRAAQELSNSLFDGEDHIVGLNWGSMVRETIKCVTPLPSQLGRKKIIVVSLFGDLEFYSPQQRTYKGLSIELNCNKLVNQLAQRLGEQSEAVPLNVPGFIPIAYAGDRSTFDAIKNFMTNHSSYIKIFGLLPNDISQRPQSTFPVVTERPNEALISHMDTIVSGFGSADNYTILNEYQRSWLSKIEIETLIEYSKQGKVVGDIGGHLVAPPGARDDDDLANFLDKLNRRILATQPNDFIEVASRHLKSGKGAGVMGLAAGARKSKILYTLLSLDPCPISRLIIDSHCALALLNLINNEEFNRFITHEGSEYIKNCSEWSDGTKKLIPIQ